MIAFSPNKYKDFALVKVDETAHTISGLVTAEVPDKDGEICDYDAAKKAYQTWANEASASTKAAGQEISYGNMRLMHQLQFGVAGKVAAPVVFDDEAKTISLVTDPEDHIFVKAKQGKLRGFSQGGGYAFRKCVKCGHDFDKEGDFDCPKCNKTVQVRYAPAISEVSYVDNPCLKIATFDLVKADGTRELRKFAEEGTLMEPVTQSPAQQDLDALVGHIQKAVMDALEKKEAKTKRKAGEDLPASAFAHVGDKNDPETWHLPIKFSTEAKTKRHIRNALARLSETGISDDEKAAAKKKIHAAAKEHGIDVAAEEKKCEKVSAICKDVLEKARAARPALAKGMWEVGRFATLLQDLAWLWLDSERESEWEGDDSPVPDELRGHLEGIASSFLNMAEEEIQELTAVAENKGKGAMLMSETTGALAKAHSAVAHLQSMQDCIKAHHEKCMKMHKAHMDEMAGHCAKMHKILGTEEAEGLENKTGAEGEAANIDPKEHGAQSDYGEQMKAMKADFDAKLLKAGETAVENFIQMLTKAVEEDGEKEKDTTEIEEDGKEKPVKKAAPSAGIGQRPVVIANGGPHIRVMPVTKAQDSNGGGSVQQSTLSKAEIEAAMGGDQAAVLKMFKSAKATEVVPETLIPALSKLG